MLERIKEGLNQYSIHFTDKTLGDRSTYVGSSDVANPCLRQICLLKTQPVKHSLKQMIVFSRGHNAEKIIENALIGAEIEFEAQKLMQGVGELDFIKTHIDFYLPKEQRIIEVKSTKTLPSKIYQTWFNQVQLQMGISGVKQATVIAIDISDGDIKEFDVIFDEIIYQKLIQKAKIIFNYIKDHQALPEGTRNDFCKSCPFKDDCHAVIGDAIETDKDLENRIETFIEDYHQLKSLECKVKKTKSEITSFMKVVNINALKSKSGIIKLETRNGRSSIDLEKLKSLLTDDLIKALQKNGTPFEVVSVI